MCKLSDQCVSFPVLFCFVNSQGFAIRTLASHINCSLLTFCSYINVVRNIIKTVYCHQPL